MAEDKPETNGPVTQLRVKHTVEGCALRLGNVSLPAAPLALRPSYELTQLRFLPSSPVSAPAAHPKNTLAPLASEGTFRAEGLASLTHVPTDTSAKASRGKRSRWIVGSPAGRGN